jgi:hypothetical protein
VRVLAEIMSPLNRALPRLRPSRWGSWRATIVRAAIVWGVALVVITEGLSLFRLLSFAWLLVSSLTALVLVAAVACLPDTVQRCDEPAPGASPSAHPRSCWQGSGS